MSTRTIPLTVVRAQRGIAIIDLLVTLVLVVTLVSLVFVGQNDIRRNSSIGTSLSNLQHQYKAMNSYAADYGDRIATFSWQANVPAPTNYPDLRSAPSALQAGANQAVDILRRRGVDPSFPIQQNWIPHIIYNHLVIADYLAQPLPLTWTVSPGDAPRACWAKNPRDFAAGTCPNVPAVSSPRWPYSSSYEIGPAFYSPDYTVGNVQAVSQSSTHRTYFTSPDTPFGNRRGSEVLYPSRKAMIWESEQRYFGTRRTYFMYPESRVPVLTFDGATNVRATAGANRGFNPANPTFAAAFIITYDPDQNYEAPRYSGLSQNVSTYYRYTRSGLRGIDLDGEEVPVPR
jgi:hypothetical protein